MSKIVDSMVSGAALPRSYADTLLVLGRGKGCHLYDTIGRKYLDFGAGISVNALGYGRMDLARVAARQMKRLIHVSNLYATSPELELADKLAALGDFSAVHFGNSGSEANETAIKLARMYARRTKGNGKHKLLCFENAFHGRTMGALSCTPTEKYQEPFRPLVPGVESVPINDTKKLSKVLSNEFAAVIVEAVQGEGGLATIDPEYAAEMNRLCKKHDTLIIADEIQTGLGRCGYVFATTGRGLRPDLVTLAKPLAGGLPLSATLIPARVNDQLHLGEHGTTFGGGPVTTAVACKVVDTLLDPSFLEAVRTKGEYLATKLGEVSADFPTLIEEVRGMGMLRGLAVREKLEQRLGDVLQLARESGLLLLRSGSNVIRIAPPLVMEEREIDHGIDIIRQTLSQFE